MTTPTAGRAARLPAAARRRIAQLYTAGLSLRQVSAVTRHSKECVRSVLIDDGVPMRRRGRRRMPETIAAADRFAEAMRGALTC